MSNVGGINVSTFNNYQNVVLDLGFEGYILANFLILASTFSFLFSSFIVTAETNNGSINNL